MCIHKWIGLDIRMKDKMDYKLPFILLVFGVLISIAIPNAYAQVYSERVDMLCPDFLAGSYFDFGETRDWIHICPINFPTGNGGDPVTDPCDVTIDTDQDGIPDCTDLCILEKENVNFFEDFDGCPDDDPTDPIIPSIFEPLFQAFGNTIITVPNTVHTNQQILIQSVC